MTQVAFYLLQDTHPEARNHYACILAEQKYQQGQRVLVRAENPEHCRHLDQLLWSFRDDSFIPHTRADREGPAAPVHIDYRDHPGTTHPILINLDRSIPDRLGPFSEILEIVCDEENSKQLARQRFRAYQSAGCAPAHHPIRRLVLSQLQSPE